ncbi:hypothetical protein TRVA0_014S01244 [Trichomonascus vanleenenianus]|uniref:F-box protein n=1 Tax=Trichomonascus vanleenenianus TaxID=2268995 RepID=UPI003EC978E4
MSIEDLPPELLHKIFYLVDRDTLVNLSSCSKYLRSAAVRALWSTVQVHHSASTKGHSLRNLVEIATQSELLGYVNWLCVAFHGDCPDEFSAPDLKRLSQSLAQISNLEVRAFLWSESVQQVVDQLLSSKISFHLRINQASPGPQGTFRLPDFSSFQGALKSLELHFADALECCTDICVPKSVEIFELFVPKNQLTASELKDLFRENPKLNVLSLKAAELVNDSSANWMPETVERLHLNLGQASEQVLQGPSLRSVTFVFKKLPFITVRSPTLIACSYMLVELPYAISLGSNALESAIVDPTVQNDLFTKHNMPRLTHLHIDAPPHRTAVIVQGTDSPVEMVRFSCLLVNKSELFELISVIETNPHLCEVREITFDSYVTNITGAEFKDTIARLCGCLPKLSKIHFVRLWCTRRGQMKILDGFEEIKDVTAVSVNGLSNKWTLDVPAFRINHEAMINRHRQLTMLSRQPLAV